MTGLGATVFVQKGFPGAGFDGIGQGISSDTSKPFAGCDLVFIFAGTNEYGTQNKALGAITDRAGSFTIYGEIWNPYGAIRAQAADCTICYVTPNDRGAFSNQPVSPAPNSKGVTLALVAKAMKDVVALQTKSYCFDLLAVSPITPANATTTTEDGLHMVQATATTVGGLIATYVNANVPVTAATTATTTTPTTTPTTAPTTTAPSKGVLNLGTFRNMGYAAGNPTPQEGAGGFLGSDGTAVVPGWLLTASFPLANHTLFVDASGKYVGGWVNDGSQSPTCTVPANAAKILPSYLTSQANGALTITAS